MSKPLVIYHANCADGFGAAFAAWTKFGDEAEYLPMQYGSEQHKNLAALPALERDIYILDFSFPKEVMDGLIRVAKHVVWLDHHKTAFEMWCGKYERGMTFSETNGCYGDGNYDIVLDDNRSGALIAWNWFHGGEAPMLFQHIDDYDRWQFKLEGTKEFNKALWSYTPWSFEQWDQLLNDGETHWKLRDEGIAILRAHNQNVQSVVKAAAMPVEIKTLRKFSHYEPGFCADVDVFTDGPKGLAANCPAHLSSDVGHELATQSGTFGLLWSFKGGKVLCSLRSNGDYDVSTIAKAFGGGGHKNAAGFETDIHTLMGWLG